MVASHAVVQQDAARTVAEMSAAMEKHANEGDWERVEEIAVKLRVAVMDVPERLRRDALLAAQRSLDRVQLNARDARGEVADKLSALRRGEDARKAYAGTD